MSYEGFEEYICENGHLTSVDTYDPIYIFYDDITSQESPKCFVCEGKLIYYHAVDQTNGVEEGNPSTISAPVKEIGFVDEWYEDRYGNKYATKQILFAPVNPEEWNKL